MWDATTYQISNAVLAAAHAGFSIVCCQYWRAARPGSVARKLSGPLLLFFGSGVLTHGIQTVSEPGAVKAWAFALRTLLACGVLPALLRGIHMLAHVPAKEESDRLAMLAQVRAAESAATAARERELRRVSDETAARLGKALGELRDELERLHRDRTDDEAYYALRRGFHEVSNAAAALPRLPPERRVD